jgi:tetratricopeptide (TPR) repeat protein
MVAAAMVAILALPARGDEFYETRLREGEEALASKRNLVAVERLRIAVFGLLDKPVLLSEGFAMLSLAQRATGKEAALDVTLARFLELEKSFAVWGQAAVKPELRKEFVALLVKKIPPENLKGIPSLSGLVETEEQKILKLAPSARGKVLESKAKAEPKDPRWPLFLARDAEKSGDRKAASIWAKKVLAIDPKHGEAAAIRERAEAPAAAPAPAATKGDPLATALSLLGEGKRAEAKAVLVPVIQKDPENREARKALLQAAYLTRDWKLSAAQVAHLEPFAAGEEPLMFYSAVALFETGSLDEARILIRKAQPGLQPGPLVDYYTKKILEQPLDTAPDRR